MVGVWRYSSLGGVLLVARVSTADFSFKPSDASSLAMCESEYFELENKFLGDLDNKDRFEHGRLLS